MQTPIEEADDRAEAPTGGSAPDLSLWLSQADACKILGVVPRTLNEMIERGRGPEKRLRPVEGRKPEPCYHPGDVERIRAKREPRTPAFSVESGVGPADTSIAPRTNLLELVDRFADRMVTVIERTIERRPSTPPPDRGPWLTVEDAAAHSGLSQALLRRVVQAKLKANSPDVILDRSLKIRRAAVDELNAQDLRGATIPAHEAKGSSSRPALVALAAVGD